MQLWRILLAIAALTLLIGCAPGTRNCRFTGQFEKLASQIPEVVGGCQGAPVVVVEMGATVQPTSTGQLVQRSVDGTVSFSDGSRTYVLDPSGQVQARGLRERFAWEFNGDGFPLVGEPAPPVDGPCPGPPLRVLAVENFYADLARQLGGQCVGVTAILSDPTADPHEFQPSSSDVLAYQDAQLVIENGLGYDDFSDRVLATLSTPPVVIDVGKVVGLQVGANPHVWYSPTYVERIRVAMTAALQQLAPGYAEYFQNQASVLDQRMLTYHSLVGEVAGQFGGTPVGATESIFAYMAEATGLQVISPPRFMQAVAEGNEPAARDIAMFHDQISSQRIRLLVFNTQTLTSLVEQMQELARDNDIPMLGVSETMPQEAQTFQGWQATQLQLLLIALQKGG
ncbi:MAG TPA: zinc ABC transporter substrate-binding protein [Chloroflexota bacterium]